MPDVRVSYKSKPDQLLLVRLIKTYKRGTIHPVRSSSGGLKETIKNQVWQMMEDDKEIDAVSLVRASGPMFPIIRKGMRYFDCEQDELEVATVGAKK